jgi:hypothetical protein
VSDNSIFIGAESGGGNPQKLELARANRHGLIAGATGTGTGTGTGKTVTLRGIVEGLSAAGVPTFVADVKGDLAGSKPNGQRQQAQADARTAREEARPNMTDKVIQSATRAAASSIGPQPGNQLLRGILGGLMRGR